MRIHFGWTLLGTLALAPAIVAGDAAADVKAGVVPFDEWTSGAPVPVGTEDRRGPLAPGVTFWPHGFAHVSGSDLAGMFMGTDRFSHPSGVFYYASAGRDAETNVPVFSDPVLVDAPFRGQGGMGVILQDGEGVAYGAWFRNGRVEIAEYNADTRAFESPRLAVAVPDLPRNPSSMHLIPLGGPDGDAASRAFREGRWLAVFAVGDGKPHRPEGPSWREPEYQPYDGRGIYRGNLSEFTLYGQIIEHDGGGEWLGVISPGERAALMSCDAIADVRLRDGGAGDLILGTKLGALHYFPAEWSEGSDVPRYERRLHVVDRQGNAIRFPSVHAYVSAYPNEKTGFTDLLVGTQGLTMYYEFSGEFTDEGKPIFEEPHPVLVEKAGLQLGALAVPNIVDWDGDGVLDIVAGNSDGYVFFSRNAGSNESPRMLPGEKVLADGHPIHVQPGYYDIQGPGEARWGYSCPTTVDWDGDGDMDIVMSDPTASHTVFLNEAGPGEMPRLARGSRLYWEHLDLHGTWRVRPAAGMLGERMAYVIQDKDNELHLYWRQDDHNVESGGKLRFANGDPIPGAYLSAGGTGRLKLLLHDWDGDGRMDIVTGTSRHNSVGSSTVGLPQALGRPGSSVLWLRNVGTNSEPVLEWPRVMAFRGKPIFFGQHSCAPSFGRLGPGGTENLVVGTEDGRIWFFERGDIDFLSIAEIGEVNRTVMIDRVFPNPQEVRDDVGEWISLRNVSSEPVDLHGWWLYSREGRQILRGNDLMLEPGESLVLGRSQDREENGGVDVDRILDGAIGLGNTQGIISLHSGQGLHDAVRWGEGSEELMHASVAGGVLIHGVVPELCRDLGGAAGPGVVLPASAP